MLARTTSVDDTHRLAAALAGLLRPGDLVLLTGEMGAGKTAFAQGVAGGLGVTERVTSPTFTIAQTYESGRIRVHHLDAYRLDHLHEALDVGLAEMLDDDALVLIEWGDVLRAVLPPEHLEIAITFPPAGGEGTSGPADGADPDEGTVADPPAPPPAGDDAPVGVDERRWRLRPVGEGWAARADGLRATVAPWEVPAC